MTLFECTSVCPQNMQFFIVNEDQSRKCLAECPNGDFVLDGGECVHNCPDAVFKRV